jgi:DNA-binding MarR family transcriptional regulator
MRADPIGRLISRRDLAMVRHRAALARELGLMDSELLALLQIAFHGELAPSSIGSLLDLSSGGATALVQRLERAGHVRRRAHPRDRRSTLIRLTPETEARLTGADAVLDDEVERLTGGLPDDHREAVAGFLAALAELCEERGPSARDEPGATDPRRRPVPSLWA